MLSRVLIVPCGIEIQIFRIIMYEIGVLIVPCGIEIGQALRVQSIWLQSLNRTMWN